MNIENTAKKYKRCNTAIYSCQYHVIFCPKYRRAVLVDKIGDRMKELVLEKQQELNYEIVEMKVMPDHVHLLIDVNPQDGIYQTVNHIKGYTSRTLRKEFPELVSRLPTMWSRSKFISSVGTVSLEVVKQYIEDQKGK